MVDKEIIIASILMLILLVPVISAHAESFTVTANKDIYTLKENVIIVGVIPSNSTNDYAIIIKVTGPHGQDCAAQNILPTSDNSFVSRPVKLDDCGFGQYSISAFYNNLKTKATFAVSNSTQTDAVGRLELRLIKNVIVQAQNSVHKRVRELIDTGYILPEDIADNYRNGFSEASLALQAIEFGDHAQAKKHMIVAVMHLRDVLDTLSSEHLAFFGQLISDTRSTQLLETYHKVQEFYYRLAELTQKNQVDRKSEFASVISLLASSKQMISEGDYDGADKNLAQANDLLESIRTDLFEDKIKINQTAYANDNWNATSKTEEAIRLTTLANRFEKAALPLLGKKSSNSEA